MARRLRWAPRARENLVEACRYTSRTNPDAAKALAADVSRLERELCLPNGWNVVCKLVYLGYHRSVSTTVRIDQKTHRLLKELAASASLPMQTLIQRALVSYSRELERKKVHEQISSFAQAMAGTDWDLDEELEQAAVDELGRVK